MSITARDSLADDGDVLDLEAELGSLKELLDRGRVEEARILMRQMKARWPDSERVERYATILAAPRAFRSAVASGRSIDQEYAWLHANAHRYAGCWLAVLGDQLLAADPDLETVIARVHQLPGGKDALLHCQIGPRPTT